MLLTPLNPPFLISVTTRHPVNLPLRLIPTQVSSGSYNYTAKTEERERERERDKGVRKKLKRLLKSRIIRRAQSGFGGFFCNGVFPSPGFPHQGRERKLRERERRESRERKLFCELRKGGLVTVVGGFAVSVNQSSSSFDRYGL
ncbi:hypothetical protein TIFTF001_003278 [Ficus carica]|uniref:Uncharacterized protein n=1 Tax=Ficus carica TaxID=3494 RepID=A0AA88CV49_FICCA|nr:hypothetical protein TIFTF001_003278 [Ficus carica]